MSGANYRFGPFFVDRTRYRVLRAGSDLELTPKLLDLLLYLLDNAGALVTKEQLLDALWANANVTDNALTQAVSELRQALDDDPGSPQYIKTVARRGYRFVAPVDQIAAAPESGVPSKRSKSRLVAFYTNPSLTAAELWERLCQTDLPRLWLPKREDLHFTESIPTLGTGKVDLRAVHQLALERVTAPVR